MVLWLEKICLLFKGFLLYDMKIHNFDMEKAAHVIQLDFLLSIIYSLEEYNLGPSIYSFVQSFIKENPLAEVFLKDLNRFKLRNYYYDTKTRSFTKVLNFQDDIFNTKQYNKIFIPTNSWKRVFGMINICSSINQNFELNFNKGTSPLNSIRFYKKSLESNNTEIKIFHEQQKEKMF